VTLLVAATLAMGCQTAPLLDSCDGITADTTGQYVGGRVTADVSGATAESPNDPGLMTIAETTGSAWQIKLTATNAGLGHPTTRELVIDCYHAERPTDGATFTDPIAELDAAQTAMQCWAWYDLTLAGDGGVNGHWTTDEYNGGELRLDGEFALPLDDGTPGLAVGSFALRAIDTDGETVSLDEGSFEVPICGLPD
jgi:hypothetical protein